MPKPKPKNIREWLESSKEEADEMEARSPQNGRNRSPDRHSVYSGFDYLSEPKVFSSMRGGLLVSEKKVRRVSWGGEQDREEEMLFYKRSGTKSEERG